MKSLVAEMKKAADFYDWAREWIPERISGLTAVIRADNAARFLIQAGERIGQPVMVTHEYPVKKQGDVSTLVEALEWIAAARPESFDSSDYQTEAINALKAFEESKK